MDINKVQEKLDRIELIQRTMMRQIDFLATGVNNVGLNWNVLLTEQRESEREAEVAVPLTGIAWLKSLPRGTIISPSLFAAGQLIAGAVYMTGNGIRYMSGNLRTWKQLKDYEFIDSSWYHSASSETCPEWKPVAKENAND